MKLLFLGTGTSTGVPEIGCACETCTSSDLKDKRLRSSALLETDDGKRILLDCGPDFRLQILTALATNHLSLITNHTIDGVLLTHEHYDHVGGLDDLRIFSRHGAIPIYAQARVAEAIRRCMPYAFRENKYPGAPDLQLYPIDNVTAFSIGDNEITPIALMHGKLPIYGYRIGKMAYLTDLKTIPETEYGKLNDLDVLVINALRPQPHVAHENIEEALRNIERIRPKRAYLTHISHHFGKQAVVQRDLPDHVHIAYDGLIVDI